MWDWKYHHQDINHHHHSTLLPLPPLHHCRRYQTIPPLPLLPPPLHHHHHYCLRSPWSISLLLVLLLVLVQMLQSILIRPTSRLLMLPLPPSPPLLRLLMTLSHQKERPSTVPLLLLLPFLPIVLGLPPHGNQSNGIILSDGRQMLCYLASIFLPLYHPMMVMMNSPFYPLRDRR